MAGYSGKPLAAKLGVKEGATVVLVGAPAGFEIGELPAGARVVSRMPKDPDLVLCFVTRRSELEQRIERLGQSIFPDRVVWLAWPKKASGVATDMTEDVVRDVALPLGLVDTKVCAVDDTWSGLKLVWRKTHRL